MTLVWKLAKWSGALAVLAVIVACDESIVPPEEATPAVIALEDVLGAYTAVTMTTTTGGSTTDQLARGTTLDLTLNADGTTTGRLFVPDGREEGGDLDADLAGTFSYDADTGELSFEQEADTFVRDMVFTAVRAEDVIQLEAERAFGGTTVRTVLR